MAVQIHNPVLGAQQAFRLILDCQARPGQVGRVASGVLWPLARGRFLEMVLVSLVDQHVTCYVSASDLTAGEQATLEQFLTFSLNTRLSFLIEADFVIYLAAPSPADLEVAKKGRLEFPEEGATLVCAVERIEAGEPPGEGFVALALAGPGIAGSTTLSVRGVEAGFFRRLEEINLSFPLGLDLILVDEDGRLACLPRGGVGQRPVAGGRNGRKPWAAFRRELRT